MKGAQDFLALFKPLITEVDCSLTADYYLQVPHMSYLWNQIGFIIKYTGNK